MKKFKYSYVLGRFQPLHLGHEVLIQKALDVSDTVIVFLGSSQESRTTKNPLTVEERIYLFYSKFKEDIHRFIFLPLEDNINDGRWAISIVDLLYKHTNNSSSVTYVSFDKDTLTAESNSLVANCWVNTPTNIDNKQNLHINATDIRRIIYEDSVCPSQLSDKYLSPAVASALKAIIKGI